MDLREYIEKELTERLVAEYAKPSDTPSFHETAHKFYKNEAINARIRLAKILMLIQEEQAHIAAQASQSKDNSKRLLKCPVCGADVFFSPHTTCSKCGWFED